MPGQHVALHPPNGAVPLSHPMERVRDEALLILANAAHPASRTNLTLRLSYNQGRTWPVSDLVYAGSSAYSALTTLASGEVGLLL